MSVDIIQRDDPRRIEAMKSLVRAAAEESLPFATAPDVDPFAGRSFSNTSMTALVDALRGSDAIFTLDLLLNGATE